MLKVYLACTQLQHHVLINYFKWLIYAGVYTWIEGFRKGTNFPQADDLNGAAQALVRLQDTYQLDMPSLAHGNVIAAQHLSTDDKGEKMMGNILLISKIINAR